MRISPIVLLLFPMLGCGSGTETAKPPSESGGNQTQQQEVVTPEKQSAKTPAEKAAAEKTPDAAAVKKHMTPDQEVVIVHFGDSTCITSYLPKDQRVEAVLNQRLAAFYSRQRIVSHNVAAGGDYIRRFLDKGRYEKAVKDKIPHIDIALIRYGHNDQKHCEPIEFKRHLEELCGFLRKDYPDVRIVLETNTWVDPEHNSGDQKATIRFNERMNSTWEVVRQLASEGTYPLVEIYERKRKETKAGNWDQRIRNQKLSQDKFGRRILDGSKDEEMKNVPGWFVDNHPNANGVNIIADEEFKTITRLWPKGLPTAARR